MDGLSINHHLWFFDEPGSWVTGFKFVNGFNASGGGSIRAQGGAQINIRDCIFENNHSDFHAGAIFVRDTGSLVDANNCVFAGNTSLDNGGAATTILNSQLRFSDCVFVQNWAGSRGGAIATNNNSVLEVAGCVFQENKTDDRAGALYIEDTSGFVESSTFYANTSPGSGTILLLSSPGTTVNRSILSGDTGGYGLKYSAPIGGRSCNVFWDNALGAIAGDVLRPDEVVANPLFCDAAASDFTISSDSPAAPAHSPCGLLVGALPTACHIESPVVEPVIITILDVGNDQGRQVRVRWERSLFDAPADGVDITGYALYRRQDAFFANGPAQPERAADKPPARDMLLSGWDYIATVPARGDPEYQYVAPTLCDSTKLGGVCWSVFFVSALTPDPLTFYDSDPDSGYSIDNIRPASPNGFTVAYNAGGGNHLSWDPCEDPDFASFQVYRGMSADFIPDPQNLVHSTAGTEWMDPVSGGSQHHYKITAQDDAGNESDATSPDIISGAPSGDLPKRYALYQNEPNPFNPTTVIKYDVPNGGGHITLKIYDVAGRLVRTLVDGRQTAGQKRAAWHGWDNRGQSVSSGVYFYRLTTPGYNGTLKMTLIQ
jgi:hypothetical protein